MVAIDIETRQLSKVVSLFDQMADRASNWSAIAPDLDSMVKQESAIQGVQILRPMMRPINTEANFLSRQTLMPLGGQLKAKVEVNRSFTWTPDFLERIGERSTKWIVEGR